MKTELKNLKSQLVFKIPLLIILLSLLISCGAVIDHSNDIYISENTETFCQVCNNPLPDYWTGIAASGPFKGKSIFHLESDKRHLNIDFPYWKSVLRPENVNIKLGPWTLKLQTLKDLIRVQVPMALIRDWKSTLGKTTSLKGEITAQNGQVISSLNNEQLSIFIEGIRDPITNAGPYLIINQSEKTLGHYNVVPFEFAKQPGGFKVFLDLGTHK